MPATASLPLLDLPPVTQSVTPCAGCGRSDCVTCSVPAPVPAPDLSEVTGGTVAAAHLLGRLFVEDLLAAPDHQGQFSTTRNRHPGVGGNYAPGLAVRWLRAENLIAPVGYAPSASLKGKYHVERIWKLLDPATAQAWLDAQEP